MSKGTLWVKKQLLKVLIFFQTLHIFGRTFTVLGEKFFGRDVKIEIYSLRLIRSIKKSIFESSLFFKFFRTLNEQLPCLAKKFCAGISKIEICTLCLQSIMLRIKIIFWNFVSFPFIRTWNINFLDSWQQSFHACCQNCTLRFYLNSFWDVGIRSELYWKETFFETWRKVFDLFVKAAFYVSKGTLWVKKTTFESSDFFSNSSHFWTNIYCAWGESFWQGCQNWKLQSSSHNINQKINFWKISLFYILQNFERTITVLGEKVLCRDIKNWNLYFMSSEYHVADKKIFLKICKFSFYSDLEHKFFGFVATEFSRVLSKLHSTCLFEFFSRCWY